MLFSVIIHVYTIEVTGEKISVSYYQSYGFVRIERALKNIIIYCICVWNAAKIGLNYKQKHAVGLKTYIKAA